MHKGRLRQGIGLFVGILLLAAVPAGITWRAVYLEKLDHRLLSAVKANDANTVMDLLARGADANVHDDPPRRLSLWQTLLETLHLKQKPPSITPSVLRLALEWRPEAGSSIKPTSEETPLIRALRIHGARLNGPEIVAHMARTYAFCSSYQDTGQMTDSSGKISFRTAFARPDRFYFDFTDFAATPPEHSLLWKNKSGVHDWFTSRPRIGTEESLRNGIGGATGASMGIASTVPSLLFPEEMDGWGTFDPSYPKARLNGIKTVEGDACYEVAPIDRFQSIIAIYVSTKAFLLRKVVEGSPADKDERVTLYYPQVNVPISGSTFQVVPK
jgi:hypothetical protein